MPPKKPAADSADPPAPSSSDAPVEEKKAGLSAHGNESYVVHKNRCDGWVRCQNCQIPKLLNVKCLDFSSQMHK